MFYSVIVFRLNTTTMKISAIFMLLKLMNSLYTVNVNEILIVVVSRPKTITKYSITQQVAFLEDYVMFYIIHKWKLGDRHEVMYFNHFLNITSICLNEYFRNLYIF
jgi:hypothetical protein